MQTSDSWHEVCSILVPPNKVFSLTKMTVSAKDDVEVVIAWGDDVVSIVYYVTGGVPFTDWFPLGWYPMKGDGSKRVKLLARIPEGGISTKCYGELVGEIR